MDDIRTLMEEVDMRIKETKQDTYEFKRDIILGEIPRHTCDMPMPCSAQHLLAQGC